MSSAAEHLLSAKLRPVGHRRQRRSAKVARQLVRRIRARWPRVDRAPGEFGFCREELMAWCEENRVDYVFGLAKNNRCCANCGELHEARQNCCPDRPSGAAIQRLVTQRWRAGAAPTPWWAKRNGLGGKGSNPRFVVISLTKAQAGARALYEGRYCGRGDMENRIKEYQGDLFADRTLSTATLRANQLRLWFASMAYVLLYALRRMASPIPRSPGDLRHDPAEVVQDRRAGYDQRAAHQNRHGLGLSVDTGMAARGRLARITPAARPTERRPRRAETGGQTNGPTGEAKIHHRSDKALFQRHDRARPHSARRQSNLHKSATVRNAG